MQERGFRLNTLTAAYSTGRKKRKGGKRGRAFFGWRMDGRALDFDLKINSGIKYARE